jgi:hypothetical protein
LKSIQISQAFRKAFFFKDTSPKVITTPRTPHFQSVIQLNLSGISCQSHLVTVLFKYHCYRTISPVLACSIRMALGRFHGNDGISYPQLPGGKKATDSDYSNQTHLDKFSSGGCKNAQGTVVVRRLKTHYRRITFTESLSFRLTTSSASLTKRSALLPQSRDGCCYVSRPILAIPHLICAHTSSRIPPYCDVSLGSPALPAPKAGDSVKLILLHLCTQTDAISYGVED